MDLLNFLTMNAANSAFNQQLVFNDNQSHNTSSIEESMDQHSATKATTSDRVHKRKRLRRHPVWAYFGDIAEKIVGCKLCSFTTISAFSTNLKMHLKSHHKQEFILVMEKELDQLVKEGNSDGEFERKSPASDLDAPRSTKRRRKTAQELRDTINRAKASIERDRGHRSHKNNNLSLCPKQPPKMENLFAQGNGFTAIEQIIQQQQKPVSPTVSIKDICSVPDVENEPQVPKVDLSSMIELLKTLEKDTQTEQFVGEIRKNLREIALIEFMNSMGSSTFVLSNAFQNFLYTMDHTFSLSTEIIQQASNSKSQI